MLAFDGSITSEVLRQIKKVSKGTDCLVISSGGNDALQGKRYIEAAKSAANLLETLATIKNEFALNYGRLVNTAKLTGARLLVCTKRSRGRRSRGHRSAATLHRRFRLLERLTNRTFFSGRWKNCR
jgi:hypothetical protein